MSLRLFTAIRIPEELHGRLAGLQSGVPDARWVSPENFHVTLSFLGSVEEGRLGDLTALLDGMDAKPFDLTLSGTGFFGGKSPHALWAGLLPSPALEALQAKAAGRLIRAGFHLESRKYSPHVTLAYLRNQRGISPRLSSWLEGSAPFFVGPFAVDHFSLVESRHGAHGPVYVDVARFELG